MSTRIVWVNDLLKHILSQAGIFNGFHEMIACSLPLVAANYKEKSKIFNEGWAVKQHIVNKNTN